MREDQRAPEWPTVRAHFLALNGFCAWCGSEKDLEVHHVQPFHIRPDLELEPKNFVTLCETIGSNCHLMRGHLGSWKHWNPSIREEIAVRDRCGQLPV